MNKKEHPQPIFLRDYPIFKQTHNSCLTLLTGSAYKALTNFGNWQTYHRVKRVQALGMAK